MKTGYQIKLLLKWFLFFTLSNESTEDCAVTQSYLQGWFSLGYFRLMINCTQLTQADDIQKEIKSVSEKQLLIMDLYITDSNVPELTANMFRNLSFGNLRIIGSNVQTLGKEAFYQTNIYSLYLQDNHINNFGKNCLNNTYLSTLNLSNNSISMLEPETFEGVINLQKLSLQRNVITSINPNTFSSMGKLKELDLSFNKLSNLNSGTFVKLKNLTTIFLHNNYLKQVDNLFLENTALSFIALNDNYISNFDGKLYPKLINHLNLSQNQLTNFNISGLNQLKTLDLSSNMVTKISEDWLKRLKSLENLYLQDNFLGLSNNYSSGFKNLISLKNVNLNSNQIKQLPYKVFDCNKKLNEINLCQNKIIVFDVEGIPNSVRFLNVSFNQIKTLKNFNLISLQTLDLRFNNFTQLTSEMFTKQYNLLFLHLQNNNINKLDLGCFKDLTDLRTLNLSYNKISNITTGNFNGIENLQNLDLSYNNLTVLDEDVFHNLKRLNYLSIAYNNASNTNIKKILSHMAWLQKINIQGNHWSCSALINMLVNNKKLDVVKGQVSNVTNVLGMGCHDDKDQKFSNDHNDNLIKISTNAELILKAGNNISYKLSINNTVFIIFLLIFVLKIIVKNCETFRAIKQKIFAKTDNEKEMVYSIVTNSAFENEDILSPIIGSSSQKDPNN